MLTTAHRKGGMRVTAADRRGASRSTLSALDFDEPPTRDRPHRAAGRLRAEPPRLPAARSCTGSSAPSCSRTPRPPAGADGRSSRSLDHPVEDDPDLRERLKAAAQAERVAREVDELRQRIRGRSATIARDFDRVLRILDDWGYVDGWSLTDAGEILARTFHECDLLIVECLRQGLLDDLEPAAPRRAGLGVRLRAPQPRAAAGAVVPVGRGASGGGSGSPRSATSCRTSRSEAGLPVHRAPDPTFIAVAFAWAAGEGFAEVVEAEELSGGDFVRTIKQLIDVLRQLALVAPAAAAPGARPSRPPSGCSAASSPRRARSRPRVGRARARPSVGAVTIRKR